MNKPMPRTFLIGWRQADINRACGVGGLGTDFDVCGSWCRDEVRSTSGAAGVAKDLTERINRSDAERVLFVGGAASKQVAAWRRHLEAEIASRAK